MKRWCIVVCLVIGCISDKTMIMAMKVNEGTVLADAIDVYPGSLEIISVIPVVSEPVMVSNKQRIATYVLLGVNAQSNTKIGVTKNTWSDFTLNYEDLKGIVENARELGKGIAASAWSGFMSFIGRKQKQGLFYRRTTNDITNAAYALLEQYTNLVYTRYDCIDSQIRFKDPVSINVTQTGSGLNQRTTFVVKIELSARKSITELNGYGKSSMKKEYLWYPLHVLEQISNPMSRRIESSTIDRIKEITK